MDEKHVINGCVYNLEESMNFRKKSKKSSIYCISVNILNLSINQSQIWVCTNCKGSDLLSKSRAQSTATIGQ